MEESIQKSIKKTIVFENKGEMFSLEFHCENISPKLSRESILSYLEALYTDLKEAIW